MKAMALSSLAGSFSHGDLVLQSDNVPPKCISLSWPDKHRKRFEAISLWTSVRSPRFVMEDLD